MQIQQKRGENKDGGISEATTLVAKVIQELIQARDELGVKESPDFKVTHCQGQVECRQDKDGCPV